MHASTRIVCERLGRWRRHSIKRRAVAGRSGQSSAPLFCPFTLCVFAFHRPDVIAAVIQVTESPQIRWECRWECSGGRGFGARQWRHCLAPLPGGSCAGKPAPLPAAFLALRIAALLRCRSARGLQVLQISGRRAARCAFRGGPMKPRLCIGPSVPKRWARSDSFSRHSRRCSQVPPSEVCFHLAPVCPAGPCRRPLDSPKCTAWLPEGPMVGAVVCNVPHTLGWTAAGTCAAGRWSGSCLMSLH